MSYIAKALEAFKEADNAQQQAQEKLYNEYKCSRFLVVPEAMYEKLLEDKGIEKRDIEEDQCSAFIPTYEGSQWVRMYKSKLSPTTSNGKEKDRKREESIKLLSGENENN
jgi:hypothetical protein